MKIKGKGHKVIVILRALVAHVQCVVVNCIHKWRHLEQMAMRTIGEEYDDWNEAFRAGDQTCFEISLILHVIVVHLDQVKEMRIHVIIQIL